VPTAANAERKKKVVSKAYITLIIWVVVIGALFAYLWRKGHLAQMAQYVAETREELRKCTWPSWEELKGSTVVVMISIFILGLFTMGVDFVLTVFVRSIT
jgi:preprotein translocase subunit SecE